MSTLPARYAVEITHRRASPVSYGFTRRSYTWLIDVNDVPAVPLVRFDPRDHFDGTAPTLRAGVERFLHGNGVDLAGGRVLMLANPRVLGYVFNPLSVFWCDTASGGRHVIAEVHNTYGERHAYLVQTDDRGRAETAKRFYVSPFNDVNGDYRLSLPEPGDALDLVITLHRDGRARHPVIGVVRGGASQNKKPFALAAPARGHVPPIPAEPLRTRAPSFDDVARRERQAGGRIFFRLVAQAELDRVHPELDRQLVDSSAKVPTDSPGARMNVFASMVIATVSTASLKLPAE